MVFWVVMPSRLVCGYQRFAFVFKVSGTQSNVSEECGPEDGDVRASETLVTLCKTTSSHNPGDHINLFKLPWFFIGSFVSLRSKINSSGSQVYFEYIRISFAVYSRFLVTKILPKSV